MTELPLIARHQAVMMLTPAFPPLSLPHQSPRRAVSCGLFFFFFCADALSDPGHSCLQDPHTCPHSESHVTPPGPARVCVHMRTKGGGGKRGTNTVHPPLRAPGRDSCLCLGMQMYRERISYVAFILKYRFQLLSSWNVCLRIRISTLIK